MHDTCDEYCAHCVLLKARRLNAGELASPKCSSALRVRQLNANPRIVMSYSHCFCFFRRFRPGKSRHYWYMLACMYRILCMYVCMHACMHAGCVILCYVRVCYAILCYVMPCYVMLVCVCIYGCMYVCKYVCMYVCMYV